MYWVEEFVEKKETAEALIKSLERKGFTITMEGSFMEYVGIQYNHLVDRSSVEMVQPGLISKIIKATGMTECNPNKVPTTKAVLRSDPDGGPMDDKWNYRSVVGMLLYLSTNTTIPIAYAVSQVAPFSPKKSHD